MGIVTGYLSQLVNNGIKVLVGGSAVSSSNPLPIVFSTATSTSRSGTIATGGTAQSLMVANAARKGWFIQNNSTGDVVVGIAQSMKVKNYPFVYPRSFVGTWIIKYQ
jgi:hypothetical protein